MLEIAASEPTVVRQCEYFKVIAKPRPEKRTTTEFQLVNKAGHLLGVVEWHRTWRQYCLFPAAMTVWSRGCLNDATKFISDLHKERRERGCA